MFLGKNKDLKQCQVSEWVRCRALFQKIEPLNCSVNGKSKPSLKKKKKKRANNLINHVKEAIFALDILKSSLNIYGFSFSKQQPSLIHWANQTLYL